MTINRPLHLIIAILVAAVLGLAVGVIVTKLVDLMPCEGEGLVCNIDEAVGGYAVLAWAVLSPLIFAVTLFVAANRSALAGAAVVLAIPLVAGFLFSMSDIWRYIGLRPYPDFRAFMVMLLPACCMLLAQWLVLRWWLGQRSQVK